MLLKIVILLCLLAAVHKRGAVHAHQHHHKQRIDDNEEMFVKKLGMEIAVKWNGITKFDGRKTMPKKDIEKLVNDLQLDYDECEGCLTDLFEEAAQLNLAEANLLF
uniref:Chemosensory protein n=1 Tax=Globodera pallida TaxID=36090 RepID=A0A183BX41_GLOPA